MTLPNNKRTGFTLIELLVVIGVLAVLLTITLIAINPARQFSQANNTKRANDVNTILNAVGQYMADHKGNLTALALPATAGNICHTGTAVASCPANSVDICAALSPTYVTALPVDPIDGTNGVDSGAPVTDCASAAGYDSAYQIYQVTLDLPGGGQTHRITVGASHAELGDVISVTR